MGRQSKAAYALSADWIPPTPFIPLAPLPPTPSTSFVQSTLPPVSTPRWTSQAASQQSVTSPPQPIPVANFSPAPMRLDHDLAHMSFDITHNPHSPSGLIVNELLKPASYPSVPSLHLNGPELYWDIPVDSNPCPFVTIFDVLQALHNCFRTRLLSTESDNLRADEIHTSFCNRVQSVGSEAERVSQWSKGPRRIDALYGKKIARFGPLFEDLKGPTLGVEFFYI